MKYASLVLGLILSANLVFGQQENAATRVYIVRHAEKESGKDPVLTPGGFKRAGVLARALKSEGIQKIYVSRTRRSQLTADSLRIQAG
ncbi:MAG TPA: histidine phosphatase family protein, partial [Ferruginibacter sp.]|nr:histidine phosphatase family protein [Ferruginibacter sp.]